MSYDAGHLLLEFLGFLLALGIACAGGVKFIDKKFEEQENKTSQGFEKNNAKIAGDFKVMWERVD